MRGFKVELSDSSSFTEENICQALHEVIKINGWQSLRPWKLLKKYLEATNKKIISLYLIFDHQTIFLPRNAKVYFYSRKVEGFLGAAADQKLYYGVGATEFKDDEVEITWYDGNNSIIEKRKINKNEDSFICN